MDFVSSIIGKTLLLLDLLLSFLVVEDDFIYLDGFNDKRICIINNYIWGYLEVSWIGLIW